MRYPLTTSTMQRSLDPLSSHVWPQPSQVTKVAALKAPARCREPTSGVLGSPTFPHRRGVVRVQVVDGIG